MKKILHLNSYYIDNNLYSKIYEKLSQDYLQNVYVPIKLNRKQENEVAFPGLKIFYSRIIKKIHTIFYFDKIKTLQRDLQVLNIHENVDIIHAHNLFIDGALANWLYSKYGKKYVVAVRMTDVSLQYKFMIHRRAFARKILLDAEKVIFISSQYKDRLLSFFDPTFRRLIEEKSVIIPNGIDDFWFCNQSEKTNFDTKLPFKLIYLGQIIKRKNIEMLVDAVDSLNSKGIPASLTIIGGSNPNEQTYYRGFLKKISGNSHVNYLGKMTDKISILSQFRQHHIFAMASINELFGLVYIEAISQNLPVIYSKDEGISPYLYDLSFAEGVDPSSKQCVISGIENLRARYLELEEFSSYASKFRWTDIVSQYIKLYKSIYE